MKLSYRRMDTRPGHQNEFRLFFETFRYTHCVLHSEKLQIIKGILSYLNDPRVLS